jgi:hypothetical protein
MRRGERDRCVGLWGVSFVDGPLLGRWGFIDGEWQLMDPGKSQNANVVNSFENPWEFGASPRQQQTLFFQTVKRTRGEKGRANVENRNQDG